MCPWFNKFLCLLVLLGCAPLAHAQIYRCVGVHGEPVFSGQPCGGALIQSGRDAFTGQAGIFGDVCPATPGALRGAINDAFQAHDVNLLAGLILWRGVSQSSARATLRSLSDWLEQPLAGIATASATGPPYVESNPVPAYTTNGPAVVVAPPPPSMPIGFRISTGGGNGSSRYFGVTEFGGCWWLTF